MDKKDSAKALVGVLPSGLDYDFLRIERIMQSSVGYGDYTAERGELLADVTNEDLKKELGF